MATSVASTQTNSNNPVIVKLGKQDKSKIKKLLRGEGSLMREVQATIDELKGSGTISADAQPVIVVVREKPEGGFSLFKS